jgi:nicotinate phosphoribosyltransferase
MRSSLLYTPHSTFAVARDEAEITSFLNNDVYKFLMMDFILAHPEYRDIPVTWGMKVRNPNIRLAEVIPEAALREQLDYVKNMRWVSPADISYLRGMTRSDRSPLLSENTLRFLETFRLPDYHLERVGDTYDLTFTGPWANSMMWEILALKIVNTLYLYHYTKKAKLSPTEFHGMMTQVIGRLYGDIEIFRASQSLDGGGVNFSEFGTRRSASTDIHRMVLEILQWELPGQCVGTSNVMLAREFGQNNPKGTNAHELRMIPTALHDNPEAIIDQMYKVDRQWMKHFPELAILLPDTYGTSFYLQNAPKDIIEWHVGCRFDSKDPRTAIPEYTQWLRSHGQDPLKKIAIPSDGLDAPLAVNVQEECRHLVGNLTFGIGTSLTNNTKGTIPSSKELFGPFGSMSVVIKPQSIIRPDGTPMSTVKLSDNPEKAMGSPERVDLMLRTFGGAGMARQEVVV